MKTMIQDYFYNTWIQTTGEGWTRRQVFAAYIYGLFFTAAVVAYPFVENLQWNWIQLTAMALVAWDLGTGVLGYNHRAIKVRQSGEEKRLHYFHHNLQHIHPLLLIFFQNEMILLALTVYWFVSFFMYVEFLETNPETGKRKLGERGEKIVIAFEVILAIVLVVLSFHVHNVPDNYRIFGIMVYGMMPVLTLILINLPVAFQRTSSIMMVASLVVVSMFMNIPEGFGWVIPVYYLKLLAGFSAREEFLAG